MPTDRLPLPDFDDMSEQQQDAIERLKAGPRGDVIGPFVPLLRSPELMTRLQLVGEYIRFASQLDDDLVELVILFVARQWDQEFEYGFHYPLALAAGLPASVVEDLAQATRPTHARPEVHAVYDLVRELHETHGVSDATYETAVEALGEAKVIEAVATAGYYTTLAMVMNVAHTPPPPHAPRLPDRR